MAEANTQTTGTQQQNTQQPSGQPNQQQNAGTQQQGFNFDYEKLAQIISGRTSTAEDAALKGYFKQQGLSQQEVEQAIADFKRQKAASTPDAEALQTQLTQAQAEAQKAQVESAATIAAVSLGIDVKTIPYVLQLADLSAVVGQDGKIDDEAIKKALNKVLEDVPALKQQSAGAGGFQLGAGGSGQQTPPDDAALKAAFGLK